MGTFDASRIEQVLINLVDNALKFSPRSGPIDIHLARVGDVAARITVSDQGPGVPVARRPQLFERFYQAGGDGFQGGPGLGLYLSRQIVERHDGQIEAQFPAGAGACFVVTLPLTPGSS